MSIHGERVERAYKGSLGRSPHGPGQSPWSRGQERATLKIKVLSFGRNQLLLYIFCICLHGCLVQLRDFWTAQSYLDSMNCTNCIIDCTTLLSDPLRASLGLGETMVTHGAPCRLPHPRGMAGPVRHCRARDSLPPYPAPSGRPWLLSLSSQNVKTSRDPEQSISG